MSWDRFINFIVTKEKPGIRPNAVGPEKNNFRILNAHYLVMYIPKIIPPKTSAITFGCLIFLRPSERS